MKGNFKSLPPALSYDPSTNTMIIIDQTALPGRLSLKKLTTIDDVFYAIKNMEVRGAPLIGLTAAYGLLLYANTIRTDDRLFFWSQMKSAANYLKSARPTAVNLFRDVDCLMSVFRTLAGAPVEKIIDEIKFRVGILKEAIIKQENAIGKTGAAFLKDGDTVMTYCNAGALATGGKKGTALAPIYTGHEMGLNLSVIACETRPVLQGMRLTAFELAKNNVPVQVICDNMAATVMKQQPIAAIFVGADRIAANGDVANKIGTYGLATLALAHQVPFYVCAPTSTLDLDLPSGDAIPIEQRDGAELTDLWFASSMAVQTASVYNPSFDVTPYHMITGGIITENGFWKPEAHHG